MNVVERIYSRNSSREAVPFSRTRMPISLSGNLRKIKESGETGIIAEFKRNSPSGFTNHNFPDITPYFQQISRYSRVGGFSVLTEPDHFHGSYGDITQVQEFETPILDKDFISTRKMVENAYNCGADAILLILDFLPENEVYMLSDYAWELGMESLIEFHDPGLVDMIQKGNSRLFGYNRRNLVTLEMEPMEEELKTVLAEHAIQVVLESGITAEYAASHDLSGYSGLLVGTSILQGNML